MQMKKPVTTFCLMVLTLNPVTVLAQDETTPAEEQSPPLYSTAELGLGYSSDDAYRFGRYTGIEEAVSYTHLTLPTIVRECRSRWWPVH